MKHRPKLLPLIEVINNSMLTAEQREDLREAIADELIISGLGKNDEPNLRGKMLDELIGRLWDVSETD